MTLRRLCTEGNKWVSLATVGAAITGLVQSHFGKSVGYAPELMFFSFLIAYRIKLYLDDEIFILKWADYQSRNFKLGMVFAVVSWILMVLSALSLSDLSDNNSYLFCLLSTGASSLWIVAEAFREGAYKEQNAWIAANAIYMSVFGFLIWLKPNVDPNYDCVGLGLLWIALAFDWWFSAPLAQLYELEQTK